jgi:hypothetical protein
VITESDNHYLLSLRPKPTWAETLHLWTVFVPRRSITGRLVFGKVWRRHDGRHLIYKRFVESWVLKRGEVMKQKDSNHSLRRSALNSSRRCRWSDRAAAQLKLNIQKVNLEERSFTAVVAALHEGPWVH